MPRYLNGSKYLENAQPFKAAEPSSLPLDEGKGVGTLKHMDNLASPQFTNPRRARSCWRPDHEGFPRWQLSSARRRRTGREQR